jgi:hypothetical protein
LWYTVYFKNEYQYSIEIALQFNKLECVLQSRKCKRLLSQSGNASWNGTLTKSFDQNAMISISEKWVWVNVSKCLKMLVSNVSLLSFYTLSSYWNVIFNQFSTINIFSRFFIWPDVSLDKVGTCIKLTDIFNFFQNFLMIFLHCSQKNKEKNCCNINP